MTSTPEELKLTPELQEYAKAVALLEGKKCCPKHTDFDDVVQFVMLQLLHRPPKFDPSRGASPKTLIYTIVQRAVLKYAARAVRHAERYKQLPKTVEVSESLEDGESEKTPTVHQISGRRHADLTRSGWSMDDILRFIDNEDARALCRLVIECDGNMSETARRLGISEGLVRYRLRLLGPKLLAAGFNPFKTRDAT